MDTEPDRQRLTRNWNELLQELRVVQTGVQILTGFLLTVPFSTRWDDLTDRQVVIYLCVLTGAVVTTGLVVAPVAFHRLMFRRHRRPWVVRMANRAAGAGLGLVALTCSGVLLLVFDVTLGPRAGIAAFVVALLFFVGLWTGPPLVAQRRAGDPPPTDLPRW